MAENKFLEKFKYKTDSGLEDIINDSKTFIEEARIASIQILKDRNGSSVLLEKAEGEIKNKQETKTKKIKKNNYLTNDPNAPELHSKKVIGAFSIIFSLVFGSVLLAYNMKRANNRKGQIQVLIFGVLYTITTITLLNVINAPNNSAIVVNALGATILNEYFWNKHLGKELKHRKRSWTKPAIISILIITPFLLAVIYSY